MVTSLSRLGCGRADERQGPKFREEGTEGSPDSGGDVKKRKDRDGHERASGSRTCSPGKSRECEQGRTGNQKQI